MAQTAGEARLTTHAPVRRALRRAKPLEQQGVRARGDPLPRIRDRPQHHDFQPRRWCSAAGLPLFGARPHPGSRRTEQEGGRSGRPVLPGFA